MCLSSIGDGGFTTGGVLWQCGVYNGSNPSLFGYSFCGPAYFITSADNLLRVRMNYYACYLPHARAPFRLRLPYTDMT